MHDPRMLLDPTTDAVRKLARRDYHLDVARLETMLSHRNAAIHELDEARAESKRLAAEIGSAAKRGGDVTAPRDRAKELKSQIHVLEERQRELDEQLQEL